MEANALGITVGYPTLSQPFVGDASLCVPSECALLFLIPQCSPDTVSVAQILSPEVLAQQQPVTSFCLRVIGQREQGPRRP